MEIVIARIVLIIGCLVNGKVLASMVEHESQIDRSSAQEYGNSVSITHSAPNDFVHYCVRNTSTLTCKLIPKVIPPGITNVIVEDQDTSIESDQFLDNSWTHIDYLHIVGDYQHFNLKTGGMFNGLANLTTLYLNISYIDTVNNSCFIYLDGLKHLTLAVGELDGSSLQSALSKNSVLPELKYFALNSGKTIRSTFLQLEYNFIESIVKTRRVECFNLSNTIVEVQFVDMLRAILQHSVKVLNVSGSFLIIKGYRPNGYIDILPASLNAPVLTTVDASHVRAAHINADSMSNLMRTTNISTNKRGIHDIDPVYFLVENLYSNSIWLDRTEFHGIFNYSSYRVFCTKLVFSGNYITIMNVTFIFPPNNTLIYLDLSNNKMEFISNGVFNAGFALQVLDLSHNRLYLMELLPEFEGLLVNLKNLRLFNLGSNNISFVPKKMFHSNYQLETLILSNNRLHSLTFDLRQFTKLCLLDIRTNDITFLQKESVDQIQILEEKVKMKILFHGNPLLCSCETLGFISWLETLRTIGGLLEDTLQCEYEGRFIDVNEAAVGKCKYLCKRTMIIAVSTSCSLVVVMAILVIVMIILNTRKRKRRANVEWLLRKSIQAGNFMCFVAMSGKEEELVNRVILQNLRRCLQEKVNLNRDLVCTGNRFKPGFAICQESYRLLKKSHVFIAVVSDAFLKSQYCRLELQEACKQDKPTILLFLGHVDTADMPEYVREVFKRNSRAWIKQNNEGYYYVVPSVQDISDALWDLALAHL